MREYSRSTFRSSAAVADSPSHCQESGEHLESIIFALQGFKRVFGYRPNLLLNIPREDFQDSCNCLRTTGRGIPSPKRRHTILSSYGEKATPLYLRISFSAFVMTRIKFAEALPPSMYNVTIRSNQISYRRLSISKSTEFLKLILPNGQYNKITAEAEGFPASINLIRTLSVELSEAILETRQKDNTERPTVSVDNLCRNDIIP